jgi:hypothetical protein
MAHRSKHVKSRKSLEGHGHGHGYLRVPCIPSLKNIGKPVPYRTPCGLEMDPLAQLRNQVTVQQLSYLQGKSFQGAYGGGQGAYGGGYGGNDGAPRDCCLLGGGGGGGGGGRRGGGGRGGETRFDLCNSGGLLFRNNPITLASNDSRSNYTFVSLFPTNGVTSVHDFAGGGPCGQRGSSTQNGGPGWRLR